MEVEVHCSDFAPVSQAFGPYPPLGPKAVISACGGYMYPVPLALGLSLFSSGTQAQGGLTSP